jgi:hypothetical protein
MRDHTYIILDSNRVINYNKLLNFVEGGGGAYSMLQHWSWKFKITMQYHYKTLLTCWDIFSWGCWSLLQTPINQLAWNLVLQLQTQHRASVFWQSNTGRHSTSKHTLLFSWTTFFALCLESISLILIQYIQDCVRHWCYCKLNKLMV